MTEKVNYSRTEAWGWECPNCGDWNTTSDDPSYEEKLTCEGCGRDFEVGEEE